jgi:asparagine synthase (glutamine-hydrolysing)
VEGITVGFEEFAGENDDEVPYARALSAHYGFPHHVRTVSRSEFEQDVRHILDAMDQPSIDGVNTWFASKAAAERGYKVALSGVGGDELFFGYSLFRQIPRHAALGGMFSRVPGANALFSLLFAGLGRMGAQPKLAAAPKYWGSLEGIYFLRRGLFLPNELPALLGFDIVREGLEKLGGFPHGMAPANARNAGTAVGLLESTMYLRNQLLRDSDWASMAHSLELRTPLVDTTLLQSMGPLMSLFGGRTGKSLLAKSVPNALPALVRNRPKTGFSLPMEDWLSKPAGEENRFISRRSPWARRWARTVLAGVTQ